MESLSPYDVASPTSPATEPLTPEPTTINPMEVMTPTSLNGEDESSPAPQDSDKKATKKRKSWGQVLPEPKTNLPPRKRAKTEDEKEQRRVERVLRNRRAAQSSRERKRLEVEALEQRNQELEDKLLKVQEANLKLVQQLEQIRRTGGSHALRDNPISLSQELFGSDRQAHLDFPPTLLNNLVNPTVNPASLSPELAPVSDMDNDESSNVKTETFESSQRTLGTSPDLTQRPAVMLCDLPCHTSAEMPKSFLASQTSTPVSALITQLQATMLLSASAMLSVCQRPLTQIAMSLKAGFSLHPSPQLLATIIWLVTIPPASRNSTLMTSSTMKGATSRQTLWQRATAPPRTPASTSPSLTLRLKSLRKILSSSPILARPLLDATLEALRLVSEGCDLKVGADKSDAGVSRGDDTELSRCLREVTLPSREALMTLMWAIKVEERRMLQKQQRRRQENATSTCSLDLKICIPRKSPVVSNKGGIRRLRQPRNFQTYP
jgi:transcriptional activator HAC1